MTLIHVKYTLHWMKNLITKKREDKKLSKTEFAGLLGVSRQTIHAIEKGKFKPTIILALKMAKVLDYSVEQLFILEKGD